MRTDSIWKEVMLHGWKYRRRTRPISVILIHSTRGGDASYTSGQEYRATINWFISPNNRQGGPDVGETWAAMASRIIGDQGAMCEVVPDDIYPAYSAGHADPIAKSYEFAQPTYNSRYDKADLERGAMEVAVDCKQYGIQPRLIPFLSGDNHEGPGIAFHDWSANGRKYGKSDPGPMFPRDWFVERVAQLMEGERVYSDEEIDKKFLTAIEGVTDYINDIRDDLKAAIAQLAQAQADDILKLQEAVAELKGDT